MSNIKSIGGNPIVLGLDGLKDEVKAGLNTPDEFPALVAGSSRAILGDPETASWMERTTAADGAALIESVKGNTLRWNQLAPAYDSNMWVGFSNLVSKSTDVSTRALIVTSANDTSNMKAVDYRADGTVTYLSQSHKYYIAAKIDNSNSASESIFGIRNTENNSTVIAVRAASGASSKRYAAIGDIGSVNAILCARLNNATASGDYATFSDMQCIDLTQMFGAGNEPATVAKFEALFPAPYYPYDAGSLLPVRMEGVETVGFNQWDEQWERERSIPASTYFPDGMRSAGAVRDELRADAAMTRVGERAYQSGDESDPTVVTDGTTTHYALAIPTTTPIDPPLPLSYRTGAGGTERVMVASGTTSAPPIFATRYPLDPADLAASIAPVDGPTAKTNHQVGDLLMLGFVLCKVTTAIATGETIAIGTNVTRTTVAAELAALSE